MLSLVHVLYAGNIVKIRSHFIFMDFIFTVLQIGSCPYVDVLLYLVNCKPILYIWDFYEISI